MQHVFTCNVCRSPCWTGSCSPGQEHLPSHGATHGWRTKKTTEPNRSMRYSLKTLTAGTRLEHQNTTLLNFGKSSEPNVSWLGKFQPFVWNLSKEELHEPAATFQMLTPTRRAGKCAIELGQPVSWSAAKTDDSLAQNKRKHVVGLWYVVVVVVVAAKKTVKDWEGSTLNQR